MSDAHAVHISKYIVLVARVYWLLGSVVKKASRLLMIPEQLACTCLVLTPIHDMQASG